MIKHQEQGFVEDNLSNLTSPISCEASVSSNSNNNNNNNNNGELSNSIYYQQQYTPQLQQQDAHLELCEEPPAKKKRNLPGNPDPESEVIALSPRTLLATNRFVCEICNKGFQRDQNLQLHRRGHNLPWKLKQRSKSEVIKKKVYVCPEHNCVHHHPSRALGDLTGVKKHFSRKHGEKIWKCDKCSKRYAVHSDWKAHSKVCGTREYRCACATLFSRRDSFITHRAFCDALAEETARAIPTPHPLMTNPLTIGPSNNVLPWLASPASASPSPFLHQNPIMGPTFSTTTTPLTPPHMSATALLQKAAQMGSTFSKNTPHVTPIFGLTTQTTCGSGSGSFIHDMMVNSISSSYEEAFGISNYNNDISSSLAFHQTLNNSNDGLTRDFFGIKNTSRQQETRQTWHI